MASNMTWWLPLLFIYCISAYNIDVDHAIIYSGTQGGHFGAETALFKNDSGKWLLIGAPLENSTTLPDIPQPGVVYICPVKLTSANGTGCQVFEGLTSLENTAASPPDGVYEQREQLLGSTILTTTSNVVVCAPRWKNLRYFSTRVKYNSPTGICYQISQNTSRVTRRLIRLQLYGRDSTFYDAAEIGFSATNTGHHKYSVVLGTPNAGDGSQGGIAVFIETAADATSFLVKLRVGETSVLNSTFLSGAYFGYAVASGSFGAGSGEIQCVVGAPGFANEKGVVGSISIVTLKDLDESSARMEQIKQFTGEQMGGGFGQSVCVADVNNDGFDDVLVGAPLNYINDTKAGRLIIDSGAVYIYYGTGTNEILSRNKQTLHGSKSPSGRFGTSIANLGDISNDGIDDIAIGAPYEDEGRGAVYIFNGGTESNINSMYSQRIAAIELSDRLLGFGYQITHPTLDVDDNLYHDFAVGSYLSDQAVLLRTRAIVDVKANISLDPALIPLNSSGLECNSGNDYPCVTIRMCFSFTGKGLETIVVNFTLRSDAIRTSNRKSSRLQMVDISDEENYGDALTQEEFLVPSGSVNCYKTYAQVQSLHREFYQAIEDVIRFNATFSLSNIASGMNIMPILHKDSVLEVKKEIMFSDGCSETGCRSNLCIQLTLSQSEIKYGASTESETITANVEVTNSGEPSFSTVVDISYSNNTEYLEGSFVLAPSSDRIVCASALNENNNTFVRCTFDEPLYATQTGSFMLRFDVSRGTVLPSKFKFRDIPKSIDFTAVAKTDIDTNEEDNSQTKSVEITFEADMSITGFSEEQIQILRGVKFVTFTNTYSLYNDEKLPVEGAIMVFEIPDKYKSSDLVNFKVSPATQSDLCSMLKSQNETDSLNERSKRDNPESITVDNTIQTISCSSGSKYTCSQVQCTLGQIQIDERRRFTISFNMTVANLPQLQTGKKFLEYVTTALVYAPGNTIVPLTFSRNSSTAVSIALIFPESFTQEAAEIDIWIIIGGCIGGLILFIILGLVLWKCGFFERKKRKAVDEYKRKSMMHKRQSRLATMKGQCSDENPILDEVK